MILLWMLSIKWTEKFELQFCYLYLVAEGVWGC
jgi:hypothetical protein